MGWSADLIGPAEELAGSWEYTWNTNPMIAAAVLQKTFSMSVLHGLTGHQAAYWLSVVISGLESNPARFRAMNPVNGWGDYDGLLKTLRAMREQSAVNPQYVWNAG